MLMFAVNLTAGCALIDEAVKAAGRKTGTALGAVAARKVAPPKTEVQTAKKGGNFCDTAVSLGFPIRPTKADIDHLVALTPPTRNPIVALNVYGERNCSDWKL